MALEIQTFYPRIGVGALSFQVRPAGFFGAWSQVSGLTQTYAKYAGPTPGTAQVGASPLGFASIANGSAQTLGAVQFLFDPLAGGAIAADTWRISFGARLSNAGATFTWTAVAALYVVNGLTGERRATVFDRTSIGAAARTITAERTVYGTVTGAAFTCFPGDYLCLEVGFNINNTSGAAVVPQADIFCDGGTAIGADNVATTDAQAALVAPLALGFSLPQAGEPPTPSVTFDEAVRLTRDAWPPGTFHSFDDAGTPDYGLIQWMGQVLKAFGWDLLDLLLREIDPLRAILKLQNWRNVLNIPQQPPDVEQLRAIVLGRLRENGPASLFNLATSIGTALGYLDPSQLELLEISATQMEALLTLTLSVGYPHAIPADIAFGGLVLETPFLTDGGVVWGSGAKIVLEFDRSCGPGIFAQLTSPDGHRHEWMPISLWDPKDAVVLYAPDMAGHAVHGTWRLSVYRDPAEPVTNLIRWSLYAPGAPRWPMGPSSIPAGFVRGVVRSGEGRWRMWWGAYADPTKYGRKVGADFGAARSTMNRMRHAYQKADLIYSKSPLPDAATTLPDGCTPT